MCLITQTIYFHIESVCILNRMYLLCSENLNIKPKSLLSRYGKGYNG